jgi:hypothetical protein
MNDHSLYVAVQHWAAWGQTCGEQTRNFNLIGGLEF